MKLFKSLIGTIAVLLGLNSVVAWSAETEKEPNDSSKDKQIEKTEPPNPVGKTEPICQGTDDK